MKKFFEHIFIQDVDADNLFETFFVSAVVSLLAIRAFLFITGYPQLGGGSFHLAHVLWGGFFMLVALVLTLAFLGKPAKFAAAILGGIGFGAFIDELGKFLTRDNDYFFQPTIALIYVVFVLLYFAFKLLADEKWLSRAERIANSLEIAKEAAVDALDDDEKRKAVQLLEKFDQKDPVVLVVRKLIFQLPSFPVEGSNIFARLRHRGQKYYEGLIAQR